MPHPHLAHDVEPRHLAATATLAAILMAAPAAIRADTTGTAPAAPPTVGLAAAALVAHEDGYRAVITDVRGWHQTLRNGCVAFVASALAQVGMTVPDERLSDSPWSNPARVTFSLDRYLADQGWTRIADPAALRAGDLVFTTGAPDHVMLFHGWADAAAQVAWVSDNQRRRARRALHPRPQSGIAAFGFARRAPTDALASVDLDDHPGCGNVTTLRRRAGAAFVASPGEVTCRAITGAAGAAAGGVVALVQRVDRELGLPAGARLLVLDRRGRTLARRDLAVSVDGYGGTELPALLEASDLGGDGRLEVWTEQRWSSPMGSRTGSAIALHQVRRGRLVEVGTVAGGWLDTWFAPADLASAGGEHWEPDSPPERRLTCSATVSAGPAGLVVRRRLVRGAQVPTSTRTEACEPQSVLAPRLR